MECSRIDIEAINFEAENFLSAFIRFRKNVRVIDEALCSNLFKIVSEIDLFLESKPKEVAFVKKDQLTKDEVSKFGVRKAYICHKCDHVNIGDNFHCIWAHVKSGHESRKSRSKRSENKEAAKASRQAKLENQLLPKKTKTLILGDLQNFFAANMPIAKKLVNLPDYDEIETELLSLIRPVFPDQPVKIYFFGSRLSGLGNLYSDLDIFIDIGDVFNSFENRASKETKTKLHTVQGLLNNHPNWSQLIAIVNARVPILKIKYKPKAIDCDIGFSNSLGFCNTKLVKYLLDLQPLAHALCIFFKKWTERSKLGEYFTTYSTVLLVVFYFQQKQLLPSVKSLQDDLKDPVEIGPWMAAFAEKSLPDLEIQQAPYLIEHFKEELKLFFNFYSTFDFEKNLISPYLGKTSSIKNLDTSPLFPRYVKYLETLKDNKDVLFKTNCINIQDPLQLNHNVTKVVPQTVVRLLKQYFLLSAKAMDEAATPQITNEQVADKKP